MPTILHVEDDPSGIELVGAILQHGAGGVELLAAGNARSGLELARRRLPDLILLDPELPDLPGKEVLRRLRADERTAAIPVVILSSEPESGAGLSGYDAYLTKPIEDIAGFLDAIKGALGGARPARA